MQKEKAVNFTTASVRTAYLFFATKHQAIGKILTYSESHNSLNL
jgi:hypothetical protein